MDGCNVLPWRQRGGAEGMRPARQTSCCRDLGVLLLFRGARRPQQDDDGQTIWPGSRRPWWRPVDPHNVSSEHSTASLITKREQNYHITFTWISRAEWEDTTTAGNHLSSTFLVWRDYLHNMYMYIHNAKLHAKSISEHLWRGNNS